MGAAPGRTGGEQRRGPQLGAPGERGGGRPGSRRLPGVRLGPECSEGRGGGGEAELVLTSGWKAAAQESESMFRVGGGGCGSAETGVRERAHGTPRAQGAPAPRRARADPAGEGSPGLEVTGVSVCRVAASLIPNRSLHSELSGGCSPHDRRCGEAGEALWGAAAATASGNTTGSPT